MTMLQDDPLDVEPDKDMVPTLSICASDFKSKRDMTRCFPIADRHVIPIETPAGLDSAEKALSRLKIRKELKELEFSSLWRSYNLADQNVEFG